MTNTTGRPPKLTPERADQILQAIRAGNYLQTAAQYAGIGTTTLYRWLERANNPDEQDPRYREFRDRLERARAEAEVRVVATVLKGIVGGAVVRETRRTLPNGTVEEDRQVAPPDARTGLEFLSRAFPANWARRQALEVTGADGGPIQVERSSSVESLAERLAGLAAVAEVVEVGDAELVEPLEVEEGGSGGV